MSASSLKSKYLDKISITVEDLQTSSQPLIYQTEFFIYNLRIGDNILSQHWQQKRLRANYLSDKNGFRYINVLLTTHARTRTRADTHARTHKHSDQDSNSNSPTAHALCMKSRVLYFGREHAQLNPDKYPPKVCYYDK